VNCISWMKILGRLARIWGSTHYPADISRVGVMVGVSCYTVDFVEGHIDDVRSLESEV